LTHVARGETIASLATHTGNTMKNYSVNIRVYYSSSFKRAKIMSKALLLDTKDQLREGPCTLADVGKWAYSTPDYSHINICRPTATDGNTQPSIT